MTIDAPATAEQKAALLGLSPDQITAPTIAGDRIISRLTSAPGNGAPIGGLKVVTEKGWFAARPSGTEEVYKLYAESFRGEEHLELVLREAQAVVDRALAGDCAKAALEESARTRPARSTRVLATIRVVLTSSMSREAFPFSPAGPEVAARSW